MNAARRTGGLVLVSVAIFIVLSVMSVVSDFRANRKALVECLDAGYSNYRRVGGHVYCLEPSSAKRVR